MKQTRNIVLLTGLCGVLIASLACGGGQGAKQADREEGWAKLQQAKQDLDAKRQKLADLHSKIEAAAEEPTKEEEAKGGDEAQAEEGSENGMTVDELQAQAGRLEQQVSDQTDDFNKQLVDFINANPVVQGQQPTEEQVGAIRMKSDEDMLIAREYIDKGGDYRRAIEIYQTALKIDPDNQKLQDALKKAQDMRYMTEERFQNVQKGMTEDEVRAQLGQVNLRNIRKYPERGVVAWFYPKENGGAAGVYFNKNKKTGDFNVYEAKFDAVKPQTETEE
jgi:tetratricopeptide (TPR) repeat protein